MADQKNLLAAHIKRPQRGLQIRPVNTLVNEIEFAAAVFYAGMFARDQRIIHVNIGMFVTTNVKRTPAIQANNLTAITDQKLTGGFRNADSVILHDRDTLGLPDHFIYFYRVPLALDLQPVDTAVLPRCGGFRSELVACVVIIWPPFAIVAMRDATFTASP